MYNLASILNEITMTPEQRYKQLIETGKLRPDPQQAQVIEQIEQLYSDIIDKRARPWWQKILSNPNTRGIYLWGDVGIGKTFMMDLFFYCLPPERKMRIHFHRFMRQVHQQVRSLQGKKNPLQSIAKNLAQTTDILCFDEFFVADIVDAMLLGNLFQVLFEQNITFFATSNVEPDDLYRHGLQRDRFLPAIALIKQHAEIIHIQSQHDYRLQTHQQAGTYYSNIDPTSSAQLKQHFLNLAGDYVVWNQPLALESRALKAVAYSHDVVWFKFKDIIGIPNCQRDYLELAQCFHTVFISEIPTISAKDTNLICNFIRLVDIFYDAQIKLILQAIGSVDELYLEGQMVFEFKRTKSRLIEMQSSDYLAKPHMSKNKFDPAKAQPDAYDWEEEM